MKKTYTITYSHHTSVYKQLTVKGSQEQAQRYACHYALNNGLMGTTAIIRQVA